LWGSIIMAQEISSDRRRPRRKALAPEGVPRVAQQDYEALIAAFVDRHGITRCPTAFAVPSRGAVTAADRAALESYAAERERLHRKKLAAQPYSFVRKWVDRDQRSHAPPLVNDP
jgi:hypothetical protein